MPKLFITVIILFGSVVLSMFYLLPEWRNFIELRTENQVLGGISAELDSLIQNRDALLELTNSISGSDLRRVDQALPVGAQSAEFLAFLEQTSTKHSLSLRRVDLVSEKAVIALGGQPRPGGTPRSFPRDKGIIEFPVNLTLNGTYESFKNFIEDLEQNLRIVDITDISFTSPGNVTAFDFSIKGKTYYQ